MFSYLSDQDAVKHMGMEPCQTVNGAMDEISSITLYTKMVLELDGELHLKILIG